MQFIIFFQLSIVYTVNLQRKIMISKFDFFLSKIYTAPSLCINFFNQFISCDADVFATQTGSWNNKANAFNGFYDSFESSSKRLEKWLKFDREKLVNQHFLTPKKQSRDMKNGPESA